MNTDKREVAISLLFCLLLAAALALFMIVGCNADRARVKTPAAPTVDPDAPYRRDWGEWKNGCSKNGNKFRWRVRASQDIGRESNIKGIYHWIDYHAKHRMDGECDLYQSSVKNDKGEWVDVEYTGLGGAEDRVRFYVELKPPVPRVRCKECGRFLEDHKLTLERDCDNMK